VTNAKLQVLRTLIEWDPAKRRDQRSSREEAKEAAQHVGRLKNEVT